VSSREPLTLGTYPILTEPGDQARNYRDALELFTSEVALALGWAGAAQPVSLG
jgi:hypothetical protein